jgi:hypothetical protein
MSKEIVAFPGIRREVETPDSSEAESRLQHFTGKVGEHSHLKVDAPANTVVVEPGGRQFKSIKEAMASITDASATKLYMLNVGAGTWNERVVLQPYVMLTGTLDPNNQEPVTIIRQNALKGGNVGTVAAAAHSGIYACKIFSDATEKDTFCAAIWCDAADPFVIGNCRLSADNRGIDVASVATISIDFFANVKPESSNVWIEYTDAVATVTNTVDYPVALGTGERAFVQVNHGGLVAHGRDYSVGAVAYEQSKVRFNFVKVTGQTWSLLLMTNQAAMTAYKCELYGPVDPRVKVIK